MVATQEAIEQAADNYAAWFRAESAYAGEYKPTQASDQASGGDEKKSPTFRGAAKEIQSYRGREWLISGPYDTGKTWAALWLLDKLLRETPKAQAVLAKKVQQSIWGTVLLTYKNIQTLRESMGFKPAQAYGGEKPEFYTYDNGARVWVGGLDNPNKLLSGERDFIYINQAEELSLDDWQALVSRCTGRGAVTKTPMLFGDCNPGPEDHWILKRPAIRLFHSTHKDNPSIYDDDGNLLPEAAQRMEALQSLTGIRRERGYLGKWVGAEGQFFTEFSDNPDDKEWCHVIEPFEIPADWPIWGSLDHGFAHNTAFGLFTQNQNDIYLIAEHVKNGWLAPLHCRAIRRQVQKVDVVWSRLKQIVAGHDVFQKRADSDGKTYAEQYQEARDPESGEVIGLPKLEKATLDRIAGARELLELLGNKELKIKPRLKIFSTCTRTIAMMKRMVHDPRDAEDVLKVDAAADGSGGDDEYDMLRYGVMAKRNVKQEAAKPESRSVYNY